MLQVILYNLLMLQLVWLKFHIIYDFYNLQKW